MLNILTVFISVAVVQSAPTAAVSFVKDVAPIIVRRCTGCHGEKINLGGYRADTFRNMFKPGVSGLTSVEPGRPEGSNLLRLVTTKIEQVRMPKSDSALTTTQVGLIKRWILEGAKLDSGNPNTLLRSLAGARVHPAAPTSYSKPLPVTALSFVPNSNSIAVSGYNEVTIWDTVTGKMIRRIGNLPHWIKAIQFTKDGSKMVVAGGTPGEYGEVAVIDMVSGKRMAVLGVMSDAAFSLALSADNRYAAAGFADATVQVYDLQKLELRWSTRVQSDWITGLSFSKDGRFVVSGSRDTTVKVLEVATGELFATYAGHNRQIGKYRGQFPVFSAMFDSTSGDAFSAGAGEWIQRWNPEKAKAEAGDAGDMEERFAKAGHARYLEHGLLDAVYSMHLRNGKIYATSLQGAISIIDPQGMVPFRVLVPTVESSFVSAMPEDGSKIVTGAFSGTLRIYDSSSGARISQFVAQPGQSTGIKTTRR